MYAIREVVQMKVSVKTMMGETLQTLELAHKEFKTGSRGYHGQGKVTVDGRKYQLNIMAVEVGSKPKTK